MAEAGGSQPPPRSADRREKGAEAEAGTMSHRRAYVRRMGGTIGQDYLLAIAALIDAGTDPALVGQAASVLAGCVALAERAQHGHQSVPMFPADRLVSEDRRLGRIDVDTHGHPPEAA